MLFNASMMLFGFGALCSILAPNEISIKLSLPIFVSGFALFFIDHCVRALFARSRVRASVRIIPAKIRCDWFEDIPKTPHATTRSNRNFDEGELQAFRIANERLNAETTHSRGWLS